jgi:hypothetical protein
MTGDRWSSEAAVVVVNRGSGVVAMAEDVGPPGGPENANGAREGEKEGEDETGWTDRPAMIAASRALSTAWVAAILAGERPLYEEASEAAGEEAGDITTGATMDELEDEETPNVLEACGGDTVDSALLLPELAAVDNCNSNEAMASMLADGDTS